MSWGLHLGTRLVSFEMTPDKDAVGLYAPARLRRGPITGVRDALSGDPAPVILPAGPPRIQRIMKILSTERTVVLAPGQAYRHPQWREHADPVSTETGLGE